MKFPALAPNRNVKALGAQQRLGFVGVSDWSVTRKSGRNHTCLKADHFAGRRDVGAVAQGLGDARCPSWGN